MAMFLAGLRGVDERHPEGGRRSTAPACRDLPADRHPALRPVFFSASWSSAHLAIKSFDLVMALTAGGPGYSTDLPAMFMYALTFTRGQMGLGAASADDHAGDDPRHHRALPVFRAAERPP